MDQSSPSDKINMTMRGSNHTSKTVVRAKDIYDAFLELDRNKRRTVALQILRNQKLLVDLYDHFLIQGAMKESGRSIPWESWQDLGKQVTP